MARSKAASEDDEQAPAVDAGPRYRLEANALHSKTYTGKIDLGTYTQKEKDKGAIDKRIQELEREGYKAVNVREIVKGDE